MSKLLTIGEVAKEAGFEAQTVRYYERRGLVSPRERTLAGYRLYDKGAVKRLRFISRAKDLGFTLSETRELLELKTDDILDCEVAKARAEAKLKDVEDRIGSLESVRDILKGIIEESKDATISDECPILKSIEDIK